MEIKFYRCSICGQIITKVVDTGLPVICCGKAMVELIPNSTDGAFEKHVPVISVSDNVCSVTVGSVIHPMIDAHYISFIILLTDKGFYKKDLKPGDAPVAKFNLDENEKVIHAYAYCNLHGLWVDSK